MRCFSLLGASLLFVSCIEEPVPYTLPPPLPPPCVGALGEKDGDGDGLPDRCDLCPETTADPTNQDVDFDGRGDACDEDIDGDGIPNGQDACPGIAHSGALPDGDGDGQGDGCDRCQGGGDGDGDGVPDCQDVCPKVADAGQGDADGDGVGDACDVCPGVPNASGWEGACGRVGEFVWEESTVAQIHQAIVSGKTTCVEITQGYMQRILRHDLATSDRPPINAMTQLNPEVLGQAWALDQAYRASGELQGTLHCVPVVLKDLYATKEMSVSAGTQGLIGTRFDRDAFLIARLRAQGALMLGMTTMDELSQGIEGIASRSGRTGNPYDTTRSPGGSSSGSGAAIGASFAVIGMGTDNCASLTIPAAYNGLVTLRPTRGLLSMSGIYPSNYLDAVPGPLARGTRDLALALDAMQAEDPEDARTKGQVRDRGFVATLREDALVGKRIGVLRRYGGRVEGEGEVWAWEGAGTQGQAVFLRTLDRLGKLGAQVVENVSLPDLQQDRLSAGGSDEIDHFFSRWVTQGPVSSFDQLCRSGGYSRFAFESQKACLKRDWWGKEVGFLGSHHHKNGENRYDRNHRYLQGVMDRLRLDALLLPADGLGAVGPSYYSLTHCVVSSVTGAPAVVFPAGEDHGLPVGMMFLGARGSDVDLVSYAYAFEQAFSDRRPPVLQEEEVGPGPVDVDAFFDLRRRIGQRAWQEVLKEGGKFDLGAEVFKEIVRREKARQKR